MLIASEWPTKTGTRTQVAVTLIFGSRIFLVSTTIFHSSLVDPSSRNLSMCGMTLKAICLVNFCTSFSSPTKIWRVWFHSSSMRSEEHTSELQSLMRISYAVFCLKKKKKQNNQLMQYHE